MVLFMTSTSIIIIIVIIVIVTTIKYVYCTMISLDLSLRYRCRCRCHCQIPQKTIHLLCYAIYTIYLLVLRLDNQILQKVGMAFRKFLNRLECDQESTDGSTSQVVFFGRWNWICAGSHRDEDLERWSFALLGAAVARSRWWRCQGAVEDDAYSTIARKYWSSSRSSSVTARARRRIVSLDRG